MSNEAIYSTILINGGSSKPGNALLQRELYIDDAGNLYYGKTPMLSDGSPDKSKKASPTKVNAYSADFMQAANPSVFSFDATSSKATVGGFTADQYGLKGSRTSSNSYNVGIRDAYVRYCLFEAGEIAGCTGRNVDLFNSSFEGGSVNTVKLVVGKDVSYGTSDPPSSAEEGQIYFKYTK